ncbi:hypothetical protein [Sphingomonas sp.]|uniref:hypothetical protein n=1 Tax=Sphingomonas sp. TaxID=28214 RepID=UPI00389DD73C
MPARTSTIAIATVVGITALLKSMVPLLQQNGIIWLIVVAVGGPWIVWDCAKQLYNAAMHGYVITGVPERHVYRDKEPSLFRNNVVAWIVMLPIIASGAVVLLLDALEAEHLIS